jgi:hypothetical protein
VYCRLRATLEKHFGSVSCARVLAPGSQSGAGGTTALGASGFASSKLEGEAAAVVSAGRDSMINIWSASGDCLSSQAAHRGTVSFLSDINYSAGLSGYSYAYSAQQGLNTKSVYASPFGNNPLMLSLGADGAIKLWDLKRFKCISEVAPSAQAGNSTKAVWCAEGFLTGSNTGAVRLYEHSASVDLTGGQGSARDFEAEYVARSGSGSPGALNYGSALPGIPASGPAEWLVRDLGVHSATGAAAGVVGGAQQGQQQGAGACTDLLCTEALCASASKSGQILRWSRQ